MRTKGFSKCNKIFNFVLIFALVLGMLSVSTRVVNADFLEDSKGLINPTVIVKVNENEIRTYYWKAGTKVKLSIDDPANGAGVDYTDTLPVIGGSNLTEELLFKIKNYDLAPGQLIALTDGISTETVYISPTYITGINPHIYGITPPGTMVQLEFEMDKINHSFSTKGRSDGTWQIIIEYFNLDIVQRGKLTLCVWDADKDVVEYTQPFKKPYFEANLSSNTLEGWDWLSQRDVKVTINDPATGSGDDFNVTMKMTGTDYYPHFVADLGSFTLAPGQVITMTDGTTTKTQVVKNMAITDVDLDKDSLSGTTNTVGEINSWLVGSNGRIYQRTDTVKNGLWMSDFGQSGDQPSELGIFNITESTRLFSKQVDEDGDATLVTKAAAKNIPPIADAGIDITAGPGSTITLDGSRSSDPEQKPLTFDWDLDNDGIFDDATGMKPTAVFANVGVYPIVLRVKDDGSLTSTDSLTVTIQNGTPEIYLPPIADAGPDLLADEGPLLIEFNASSSIDPAGYDLSFDWDMDNDGVFDDESGVNPPMVFGDNGVFPIYVRVTNEKNISAIDMQIITIFNVAPILSNIVFPENPQIVNTPIGLSATFTDPGFLDTFTAVWDWKDGTTSAGMIEGQNITGTHSYKTPGVYPVMLTITDDDGGTSQKSIDGLVVISPSAASVFGSGWINSPAGSTLSSPMVNGKVNFDFNASYRRSSASSPSGKTSFTVRGQGFKFVSSSYNWLIINGKTAFLEGSGTVNGAGDYRFLVSIQDGAWYKRHSDMLRIKIWNKTTGEVIYDTQPGAADNALATTAVNGGIFTINK